MERTCSTCKYRETALWKEPCRNCKAESMYAEKWEPIETNEQNRHEIKLEKRPEMLPMPLPIYERTESEIPEKVRISFTNGTSAIYELHVDQPAPIIVENIRIIRKWKTGYQAPKRRERR